MVLQQKRGLQLGLGESGESISVSGSWGSKTTVQTDEWQMDGFLVTPSFGGPYSVEIRGENLLRLENVLIGERSGFRRPIQYGLAIVRYDGRAARRGFVRIFRRSEYSVPSGPIRMSHKDDVVAEWKVCNPDSAATCSAVTFYFARKLHRELGIPIGVVLQPMRARRLRVDAKVQLGDPRTLMAIQEADAESAKYDLAKAQVLNWLGRRKHGNEESVGPSRSFGLRLTGAISIQETFSTG